MFASWFMKRIKSGAIMSFEKPKRVKLKGPALAKLNRDIHIRDHNKCVICGAWVNPAKKFHHEPCGVNRSDELGKGVVLCDICHFQRHNGKNSAEIRDQIQKYLEDVTS